MPSPHAMQGSTVAVLLQAARWLGIISHWGACMNELRRRTALACGPHDCEPLKANAVFQTCHFRCLPQNPCPITAISTFLSVLAPQWVRTNLREEFGLD